MPISLPVARMLRATMLLAGWLLAGSAWGLDAPVVQLDTASFLKHTTIDPRVLAMATDAVQCARDAGYPAARHLGVIDFTLPSNVARLWVVDLASGELLFRERVAHGRGSGADRPVHFSNVPDSNQSSLGLFRTLDAYEGSNGYSLNLQGLEQGINDRAYDRRIVIHGADYVSDVFVKLIGRVGRSFGCPAVRREIAIPLIDSLKEDQYLFAYYPDRRWMKSSAFLGCHSDRPVPGLVKTGPP